MKKAANSITHFFPRKFNSLNPDKDRSRVIKESIVVVWELRDYKKILEQPLIKIIDFATLCFLQLSQNQLF